MRQRANRIGYVEIFTTISVACTLLVMWLEVCFLGWGRADIHFFMKLKCYLMKGVFKMVNTMDNNKAAVIGTVEKEPEFNHEIYGEKFYMFTVAVARLSDINDYIRVMISERLIGDMAITKGRTFEISGQFRSYNSYNNEENKLVLTLFAKDIEVYDEQKHKNPNVIYLNGFVCKPPVYRTTPFGREITDMLVAVNRTYNKSDYIPVIAWGRNARYCRNLKVGDNIIIRGRIQSRDYQKHLSDDEVVTRTAYEISISKLEVVDKEEHDGLTGSIKSYSNKNIKL